MGLFTKKDPCAICGGKVKGLLPWKIDGQYICDDCHGVVDIQKGEGDMTLEQFCQYRAFREENQALKGEFVVSQKIDFGAFDTKIVFDFDHKLFCMSKNLDKTIFHGAEVKSFIIKEDGSPIFEGGPQGLIRYESIVPERLAAMAPSSTRSICSGRWRISSTAAGIPSIAPPPGSMMCRSPSKSSRSPSMWTTPIGAFWNATVPAPPLTMTIPM